MALTSSRTLITALSDKSSDVGRLAIEELGKIGDTRAVEPLISILLEDNHRYEAIKALSKIGDHRAIEPLIGGAGGFGLAQ